MPPFFALRATEGHARHAGHIMPPRPPPGPPGIFGGQAATTPAAPATPDRGARSAVDCAPLALRALLRSVCLRFAPARVGWFRDRSRRLARAVGRDARQEWILRRPTTTILDPRPCGRRQEARIGFAFAKARWNQACSGCFGVLQGNPAMVARVVRSQSARASQEGRPPAPATERGWFGRSQVSPSRAVPLPWPSRPGSG